MAHLRLIGPLRQAGIQIIAGIEDNRLMPDRVAEGDLVILQREIPQRFDSYQKIMQIAHQQGKPVVFDLDDLLLDLPENHPDRKSAVFAPALLPMFQALKESDLVTVATPRLKEALTPYSKNIAVLPNFFDDTLWRLQAPNVKADGEVLTIGYMGGMSHGPDIQRIVPVLLDLIRRYPRRVKFCFLGTQPPAELLACSQVQWIRHFPFAYRDFVNFFQTQSADIFIAPLEDNLFNRCKSPLKFFEYTALGAPGVFSNLETYSQVVTHGQNGLLATSLSDWEDGLVQLIENADLRYQMAVRAQETIKEKWLLSKNASRWNDVFENLLNQAGSIGKPEDTALALTRSINTQLFDAFSMQDENLHTLKETVAALTAQVVEKENAVAALTAQVAEKESVLQSIFNSPGWKILNLFHRIRVKLFPDGSRRERGLRRTVQAVYFWRQYGLQALLHKAVNRRKQPETALMNAASLPFALTVQNGTVCLTPSICVVIEKNERLDLPPLDENDVVDWVSNQTLDGVEVVVWNSDSGTASALGQSVRNWDAPDLETLCREISAPYLCMASPDLMRRNRIYLEANLIALETEGLAFTVNLFGAPNGMIEKIRQGQLPGRRTFPYLRLVFRKECARNDFSLDVSKWASQALNRPVVVGKIITHTTNSADDEVNFPLETMLTAALEYKYSENYFMARSSAQIPWTPLELPIHPVDTVMPSILMDSALPTVIVFMPFLAVGGAERLALQLIRRLQARVRFVVVTLEGMAAELGTTADFFHQATPFVYTAADYLQPSLNFSLISYLIERFCADTFYIANGANFIYDALSTLRHKYPNLRIVDQVYDHRFGWINRYDRGVVASLDACISANPNISRAYADHGVGLQKIHFVEHAINMDDINPEKYSAERRIQIKQALGLPLEKKIITFCARLHPQKRPVDFIELARRFSERSDLHFLMVGDGPLSAAVDQQILRAGLVNITRSPFYSPVADIYAITDVMVLPSEYEAMPLVVLESLAMGKPVVATDVGYIRDILDETKGGKIVTSIGDVSALRVALLQVLEQKFDSVLMRDVIRRRFGVEYIAEQYLKVWLGH
ncbi:MAG: hypothetical protein Fur0035_08300 [Anaerolineales bacterium]